MPDQETLVARIARWFRRKGGSDGNLPLLEMRNNSKTFVPVGSTFFRPWARRDAAIDNLQHSFLLLTDLMSAIKDNLEKQNQRQEELSQYLAHLPEVIQSIPDNSRLHYEALKAIHQQMEQHNGQQKQLGDILDRISQASGTHQKVLEALNDRVESLNQHDQTIAGHMHEVGTAMQTVTQSASTTTQVLENLRDNLNARDGELERILRKQGNRFTLLLAMAIVLSVAALLAAVCVGWFLIRH
jgi:chromosome segregation ATPase